MKTLHLTLKKKWFDMITSGEKKEEYREIKPYWSKRLVSHIAQYHSTNCLNGIGHRVVFKEFDNIIFKNGYSKASPKNTFICEGIKIGMGKSIWGAEKGKEYFIIKIGDILPF